MTVNGWIQILFFFGVILACTKPMGIFMHQVMEGERHLLTKPLGWLERLVYRLSGVGGAEQRWTTYSLALLVFSLFTLLVTYAIQRWQGVLPLNPQHLCAVEQASAFNTAVSFTTNTNWQGYTGEATMSYLTQMAGLAWHNFISAAAGIAIAIALARGLTRRGEGTREGTLGNFWVNLTRSTIHILLPLSAVFALAFVSQGTLQNLSPYKEVTTLEGTKQVIAMGPVASQEAIKQLGTNGGGFFNANAAHPFENPNAVTNFFSMFLIFLIPAGLTYTFGRMARDQRQGWALFGAMAFLFFCGVVVAYWAESAGNPIFHGMPVAQAGNLEGKEVRFGIANSALYATATTDASCGAVNGMHDSFTPLGGLVPLVNIMLGEVIFGGVGAGLYGILIFVILSVFIAGLMVGRTPEYLGKKIEAYDVKMAMLAILIFPLTILILVGISSIYGFGTSSIANPGPHGLSEILYAFTSGTGNNGSAFAGLNANTHLYNTTIGLSTLLGRFFIIIPMLAIAGILARKQYVPPSLGTFPVTTPLFTVLLTGVIVIVGALTFFPALSLGPILEHLLMGAGKAF